ncbi:hypothetical protein ASY01nite_24310 [Acetobacter syzygii]|uniref:hypothetical protein n=1 Tax=Acetobacter syzygii TaxID=146476 RepID=UPI0005E52BE3|nr:hypothetical protein [Acetobacter syzygii]GAN72172.1 hypothetical protein Absy_034_011 [Acetobacter syzygii]GBR64882.1 hypothetical protein AA0483_1581 [Acetobacter syzygii NRIC 0483]GEL57365.1 hypothetical protein ASY01nite_24310 [Acetobacter syzygii]
MTKFLVSYLFDTTQPDLHAAFKTSAEKHHLCEYIYATDDNGKSKYCKLPHTTLWGEGRKLSSVYDLLLNLAETILKQAEEDKKISSFMANFIKARGGLIENMLVSPLIAETGSTTIMQVKEGKFTGRVDSDVKLADCLEHQKK